MAKQLLSLSLVLLGSVTSSMAQTAFTYQGKLTDDCCPATGLYDLSFSVWDAASGPAQLPAGNPRGLALFAVPVTNGLFTVRLDFGNATAAIFNGERRWLQIDARTNNAALAPVTLLPRTELTPSPSAIFALRAAGVTNGAITPAMINSAAAPTANQILSYDGSSFQWINTPSGTFSLPYSGTFSSAGPLLALNNSGSGPAASFLGSGDQIHLQGTAIGGPNFAYMSFADSAGTLTGFVGDAGSDTAIFLGAYSGSVVLYTSPAGRVLTATPTGNVGIGTSDPGRRLTIQAAYDGDGVQVIGSRAGVKDAGYILSDDTGNTAALGLATFANAWFTGAQPGDLCLGANQGNVRIGVATGLETPVMSVGRKTVVLSPNYPDAGNVTLTAASVDGTALYCHSYGTPFHAHNDFTGTDAVLAGGWHAFTGNVTVRTSPGYGIVHTDGIREVGTYVDDSGGWLGTKSNHPLNLFVNDGGAALRIDTDNTVSLQVLTITGGADIAEPFPMTTEEIPKGAVVTIDEDHPGQLKMSESAYDTRVAGIISGANGIKPGVSLHQQGALEGTDNVALSGRVYALADASEAPIKPGDLLTTSATPGHCMKVTDHAKAQGTIIGKAMSTLKEGKGMVLVLVSLQ